MNPTAFASQHVALISLGRELLAVPKILITGSEKKCCFALLKLFSNLPRKSTLGAAGLAMTFLTVIECSDKKQEFVATSFTVLGSLFAALNTVLARPRCKRSRKQKYTWKLPSPQSTARGHAFSELPYSPCVGELLSVMDNACQSPGTLIDFCASAVVRAERKRSVKTRTINGKGKFSLN